MRYIPLLLQKLADSNQIAIKNILTFQFWKHLKSSGKLLFFLPFFNFLKTATIHWNLLSTLRKFRPTFLSKHISWKIRFLTITEEESNWTSVRKWHFCVKKGILVHLKYQLYYFDFESQYLFLIIIKLFRL